MNTIYNNKIGELPENSSGLGKFLGIGLVIWALWSFLSEKTPNKISIAGIKRRKSKRLFYMLDTGNGLTAVARQDVDNIKARNPNRLHAVWALNADDARALIKAGQGERYTGSTKKLDFAGHLLNCIGWQQVVDKNGKQITRCFIMAPNCKTKACVKETEERKAEGWKPKGRKAKALQGVNLSCKQYVRDAYNKLRCKKYAITCNSENECGPKATIPWKPVDIVYTPKAIRSVAKMLTQEMNQSLDDTKRVMRRIKYHGGIAPYSGGYLQEEYRDIPSKYKSKEGVKLDELAQEMEMDESALVEAINKAEEARSRLPKRKSRFSVKDMMFEAESYLAKQEGLSGLSFTKRDPLDQEIERLKSLDIRELNKQKNKYSDKFAELSARLDKTTRNFYNYQARAITKREAEFVMGIKVSEAEQAISDLKEQLIFLSKIEKVIWDIMPNAPPYQTEAEKPKSKEMTQTEKTKLQEQLVRLDAMVKEAKKAEHKIAEKGGQMTLFGKFVAKRIAMRA